MKKLFPDYKQEDNLPLGLEVAGDRLFITVPRWKRGVVASLNYIKINGGYIYIYVDDFGRGYGIRGGVTVQVASGR